MAIKWSKDKTKSEKDKKQWFKIENEQWKINGEVFIA